MRASGRRTIGRSKDTVTATTRPVPDWPRRIFFGAWLAVGVVVAVLLVATAGHPLSGGPSDQASYIGSQVPVGTNFTFLISESIALYEVNLTGTSPTDTVTILLHGTWSASASTYEETTVGGASTACPYPWGCYGSPGTTSGSINSSLQLDTDPALYVGLHEVTVAVVFWALATDTVTATSPIFASLAP